MSVGLSGQASVRFTAWTWKIVLVTQAVAAVLLLVFPLSHLTSTMSFDYSEGWNSYWADHAAAGIPLYAQAPDLNITNYPPISFHLVGLLGRLIGNVTVAGRMIALLAFGWAALNIGTAAAYLTGSRRPAFYAAFCYLLWTILVRPGRIATNDPQFLGIALVSLGLCAYLRADEGRRWLVAAGLFFATALFVKNNLIAFPTAVAMHLVLCRRWRPLGYLLLASVFVSASFLVLTTVVDGHAFFSHLLGRRSFRLHEGVWSILTFYQTFYAPVVIGLVGLLWCRSSRRAGFVALCFCFAAVIAALFAFGNGVAGNIYYEELAILALKCAVAVAAVQRGFGRVRHGWAVLAAAALLPVLPVLTWVPTELYGAIARAEATPVRKAEFDKAVALIETTPGPALCESLLMCLEAEKPFVYDAYYVRDQIQVGRIPEERISADLRDHRFGVVQIGEDDSSFDLTDAERPRFSAGVMHALLENYQVVQKTGHFAVLVPK